MLKKDEFWQALKLLTECDSIWNNYIPEIRKQNESTYAAICFQHAKLLIERNNLNEAIKYLEKALEIKPNENEYQYQLSKSYLNIGNVEKAKETFPKFARDYFVKELEIDILIEENKHEEAINKYKELLKYRKKDYLYRELGYQYYEIEHLNDAMQCIISAEKLNSNNHLTMFTKGKILYKAGFLLAAKEVVEKAILIKKQKFSSDFTEAYTLLVEIQKDISSTGYRKDDQVALNSFINKPNDEKPEKKLSGKVIKYDSTRGFGFIESDGIKYFFHVSNVPKTHQEQIAVGIKFFFNTKETEKGLAAINISITDN